MLTIDSMRLFHKPHVSAPPRSQGLSRGISDFNCISAQTIRRPPSRVNLERQMRNELRGFLHWAGLCEFPTPAWLGPLWSPVAYRTSGPPSAFQHIGRLGRCTARRTLRDDGPPRTAPPALCASLPARHVPRNKFRWSRYPASLTIRSGADRQTTHANCRSNASVFREAVAAPAAGMRAAPPPLVHQPRALPSQPHPGVTETETVLLPELFVKVVHVEIEKLLPVHPEDLLRSL
jgi:hypothetical protein